MKRTISIQKMTSAALLIALGVAIPLFSPLKLILEPASFTLASHVPVFIAMFISPPVTAAVVAGSSLGFLLGPFPPVVALRAASHIVFGLVGSFYLKNHQKTLTKLSSTLTFSGLISVLHALCEVVVVCLFYFSGNVSGSYYEQGFVVSVIILVGVGSFVHSMVDFGISRAILAPLSKQNSLKSLFYLKSD